MSIRSNHEIEEILGGEDVVRFVNCRQLAWACHVEQMGDERIPKILLHGKIEIGKKCRRPKKRWMQHFEEDLRTFVARRCWEMVQSREEWRCVARETKAYRVL